MKKILVSILIITIILTGNFDFNSKSLVSDYPKEDYIENVDKSSETKELNNTIEEEQIQEDETDTSNVSLIAVGDIMFHLPQINAAKTELGTYDFNPVFKHIKKYIEEADIAIGNFETVTAGNSIGFSGFPRFNSPIETLSALKNVGFDILSTANNHSLDQGKKGIINTIDGINELGLKNIGTFKEKERPLLIEEKNGIKLGFISYTFGLNGLDSLLTSEDEYMINILDEALIKKDIMTIKDHDVDMVIIYIHWGYEYHIDPSEYQIELARKMVEWGANIILGSHPHTIQKTEIIEFEGKDNLVLYSMGNFLSNQRYDTMGNSLTEDGVMVQVELEKDNLTNKTYIKGINYIPTWVHKYKEAKGFNYKILPIEETLTGNIQIPLIESISERLDKSYKDTINSLSKD